MQEPMITIRNLTKRFDGLTAVDDLTLDVHAGEVLGILGPNGAGKTTTLRMLSCLISPSSGGATVCGHSVGHDNTAVRRSIGILTEVPGLYEELSAQQNMDIYARLYGVEDPAGQVEKYLKLLDLWDRRDEAARTFSRGMKQKLAIARTLIHEPRVIFLDEPTSGLDPRMTKVVRDFIRDLHDDGRTILLCTHNLDEAQRLCDRIAMVRSRLVAIDRAEVLRRRLFGRRTLVRIRRVEEEIKGLVDRLVFVSDARLDDRGLTVTLEDPGRDTPELVRSLVAAGADILSVTEETHSLEDIYLRLMGDGREEEH